MIYLSVTLRFRCSRIWVSILVRGKVVRCLYSQFFMPTQHSVNVREWQTVWVVDTLSSVRTLEELVFSLSLLCLFVHNTGASVLR